MATSKTVDDVRGRLETQMQHLKTVLAGGEKKVKALSHSFNNSIFKRAQEAYERCEHINQQADDMRDQVAADHAATKKELVARRKAVASKVAASASAAAELRVLQEEAAALFAGLRSKMLAGGGGGQDGGAAKKRHKVAFDGERPGAA